jgi:hypothetical protein
MSTVDKSQYFDEQSDYEDKVDEEPPKKKVKRSPDSSMFDQLFHKTEEKFNFNFLESESEDDDGDTESEPDDGDTESEDDEDEA